MGRENVIGDVEFVFTHTGMTVETMRKRDSIREECIEKSGSEDRISRITQMRHRGRWDAHD